MTKKKEEIYVGERGIQHLFEKNNYASFCKWKA